MNENKISIIQFFFIDFLNCSQNNICSSILNSKHYRFFLIFFLFLIFLFNKYVANKKLFYYRKDYIN